MSLCTKCIPCLSGSEVGIRPPGSGVMDGCGPQCGCWEPNSGPAQKQPVCRIAVSPTQGQSLSPPPRIPKINSKYCANEHDREEIKLKTALQTSLEKTLAGVNPFGRCLGAAVCEARCCEDGKLKDSKPCSPSSYHPAMEEAGNTTICGDKGKMKMYEHQRSIKYKATRGKGRRRGCGVALFTAGRRETMSIGNEQARQAIMFGRTEEKAKTRTAVNSFCSWRLQSCAVQCG